MAAPKSFTDIGDITEDFQMQLTCSICQDIFTDPKTLPCLHTYCQQCIAQWYARSVDPVAKRMECPMCKTKIVMPGGDPSKLPSSFYHNSLLPLLRAIKSKAKKTGLPDCTCVNNCEQSQALVAFCPQCNGFLCEVCFNAHERIIQIREEHQATMLGQFKKENVNSFIKNQMLCKEKHHEKNKLEYYCQEETCRLSICQKCSTLFHRNHRMQSLEEAGEQAEKIIIGKRDDTKQLIEICKQESEETKKNMQRIEKEIDEAKRKAHNAVEMICIMANEHGRAIMRELDQTLEEQRRACYEEQMAINGGIGKLNEFVRHCQAVVDRGAAYEEIESKEIILERGKMLSKTVSMLCSQPTQLNVTVDYLLTGQVMQSLQNIGRVLKSVTDPAQSTIELVKSPRGFINECNIITRNTEGEVCRSLIKSIDVKIKDVDGNDVEKKVSKEPTGKCRVSFKQKKTGPHEIQVNIEGKRVKNSPQNVDILDVNELFKPVETFGRRGSGAGQLNSPWSIAVGDNGEIAIADCDNHRIQVFNLDGKCLRIFGSEGTGEGQLNKPFGVVFNEDRIIVSDGEGGKGRIQEFDLNGTYVRTIYRSKQWFSPRGMCVNDDQNIAVCCLGELELGVKPSIKVFSKQGDLVHEFHMPDDEKPWYITYGNGKYFVSCFWKNYVRVFDVNGNSLYVFGTKGGRDGQFDAIFGLAVYGPDMILVSYANNHRVQLFSQEGHGIRSFGSFGSGVGQMDGPVDVVVTADARVFVLEFSSHRVSVWY